MYKNKKIKRFALKPSAGIGKQALAKEFDLIDGYFEEVRKYIYTDIAMTDHIQPVEIALKNRLQMIMSTVLIRSLLLKDGIVQALNEANFPSFYAGLKSFMEISGLLGYLADLVRENEDHKKILEKMMPLYLGNREAGNFPVGDVSATNTLTMFSKADRILANVSREVISRDDAILSTSYADVCNFGHPNFNAHLSIGGIRRRTNKWEAKRDAGGYKTELHAFYMPPLIISIRSILLFCHQIVRAPKVNHFEGLDSKLFFRD